MPTSSSSRRASALGVLALDGKVGFDQVAHPLDRIALEARALVAVGELRRRQRLAAPGFDIAGIETLQGMGDAGAEFGQVAQLLFRQIELAEQGVGENLVEFGEKAILVGGREVAQVEIVGFRQPQQNLRRDRALIALDQIDVARGDAEALRDLGLRQAELLPDAAEARADEQLLARIGCHCGTGLVM